MTSEQTFKGFENGAMVRASVVIGLVWVTLSATPLLAQRTTGDILGRVTDESGAVVPGVLIEVTHHGTGAVRSAVTDGAGNYHIPFLPVGTYAVKAALEGFKTETVTDLLLNVVDRARVDFSMEVGEMSEQVEVRATGGLLQTDSSEVGLVVTTEQLSDLPLNGRNFIQLNELSAGAVQNTGFRSTWYAFFGGNYSINGSGPDGNNFLVDGIRNMGINDTRVSSRVNLDSIAEFKQQAGLYSAEFGSGGGAQINLVTKSGTNNISGSAFGFLRDSAFDARNFFARPREERREQGLSDTPPFSQHQFGGTIGGPIARDRTFFFGQYEGFRLRKSFSRYFTVPTDAMRAGDFSGLAPIFDPLTTDASGRRVQFHGNRIPAERLDPVALNVLERLYPRANHPGLANNYFESPLERNTFDQTGIKIDHKISANNTIMGRYNFDDQRRLINGTFGRMELFSDIFNTRMQNAVIQSTSILGPATVNEFRVGYSRMRQMIIPIEYGTPVSEQLGIMGTNPKFPGAPNISIAGFVATGGIGNGPNNRAENTFTITNNFFHTKGNHALGAGFDIRRHHTNGGIQFAPRGTFSFTSGYTSQPGVSGTGHSAASFILGYPAVASRGLGDGFGNLRSTNIGIYVKDDWKATPQLTLNLGLRWELYTPTTEATDRLTNFSTELGRHVSAQEPDRGGLPRALYHGDYNNFAPRIGLAWRPFASHNRSVVRAGYGVFYNLVVTGMAMVMRQNTPHAERSQFFNDPLVPEFTMANAFSRPGVPLITLSAIDPNFRNGYNQQWIVDFQQELLSDLAFTVGYIGNKGTKIQGGNTRDINQPIPGPGPLNSRRPYPGYSTISQYSNFGSSIYHALSVELNKRLSRGFSSLVSYRWSHMIDVGGVSAWGFTSDSLRRSAYDIEAERGNSTFDARHRFVWSFMWDLPIGQNRALGSNLSGFTGWLLSGWAMNGIVTQQSGTPVDVALPFDNSGTGCCNDRPDRVGDPNTGPRTVQQWFNTAAFGPPAPGTFGNAGRNIITGPGIQTVDFSVFKSTRINGSQMLQFRAEFFNLLNHANFNPPGNVFGTSSFGAISSAADGRQIQFGLKYLF